MKRLLFLLLLALSASFCRAQLPEFTNRLVNDYAEVLSNDEVHSLESRLRNYFDSTSNCIVVVITNDLLGYDASDYAQRLGEKWGVGTGKYSNGLVVLLSPDEHEIFIATGYGLEGVLPDVVCHRIAEHEMKPYFKEEAYYEGLEAGLNVILPIAAKEYSYEQYEKDLDAAEREEMRKTLLFLSVLAFLFAVFCVIIYFYRKVQTKHKLALNAIVTAKTKEEMSAAIDYARKLKISVGKVNGAVSQLNDRCVRDIVNARTYRKMVDLMSVALELGVEEPAVQQAKIKAIAGIIAAVGDARSVSGLQAAIKEAELAGAKEHEIASGREKARMGTIADVSKATNLSQLRELEEAAKAFGVRADELRDAEERAAKNALARIRAPKDVREVAEDVRLAEALGVSKTAIASAKEDGQRFALKLISQAHTNNEVSEAAELALYLGAATIAVIAAKKLAQSRLHRSVYRGGGNSWGGGGFSGGGSSGTFGGFGGGHFGGGGGGAKW